MIIGTIKEKNKFENRVAISPDEVKNYVKAGHQVFIEKNAGLASGFTDKSYKESGATISSSKEILKRVFKKKLRKLFTIRIHWICNIFEKIN